MLPYQQHIVIKYSKKIKHIFLKYGTKGQAIVSAFEMAMYPLRTIEIVWNAWDDCSQIDDLPRGPIRMRTVVVELYHGLE